MFYKNKKEAMRRIENISIPGRTNSRILGEITFGISLEIIAYGSSAGQLAQSDSSPCDDERMTRQYDNLGGRRQLLHFILAAWCRQPFNLYSRSSP